MFELEPQGSWRSTKVFLRDNGVSITEKSPDFSEDFENAVEVWQDGGKLIIFSAYDPDQDSPDSPGFQVELERQPKVARPMVRARFSLVTPQDKLAGFLNRADYHPYEPFGWRGCQYITKVYAAVSLKPEYNAWLEFSRTSPEGVDIVTRRVSFYITTGKITYLRSMGWEKPSKASISWSGMRRNFQR